jgi:hypothetical protein
MCIYIYKFIYVDIYRVQFIYKSNLTAYMVYIDRYIPIYMFKYVYVHIRVRKPLEYTLKLKKKR